MALERKDIQKIVTDSEKRILAHVDKKIEGVDRKLGQVDKKIDDVEEHLTKKIEDEVGSLAAMTAREFKVVHQRIDDLGHKIDTFVRA